MESSQGGGKFGADDGSADAAQGDDSTADDKKIANHMIMLCKQLIS